MPEFDRPLALIPKNSAFTPLQLIFQPPTFYRLENLPVAAGRYLKMASSEQFATEISNYYYDQQQQNPAPRASANSGAAPAAPPPGSSYYSSSQYSTPDSSQHDPVGVTLLCALLTASRFAG
ncbi:unnamed protein product [Gongylonema pulchrum]|uniref:Uncharacterized protein n=1 Tax=Gongylonema pulchrum TaxID=637853 RepID=A0A3P6T0J3_9BILA|nr:unnamed protein product [Gongylonema pulchrum]